MEAASREEKSGSVMQEMDTDRQDSTREGRGRRSAPHLLSNGQSIAKEGSLKGLVTDGSRKGSEYGDSVKTPGNNYSASDSGSPNTTASSSESLERRDETIRRVWCTRKSGKDISATREEKSCSNRATELSGGKGVVKRHEGWKWGKGEKARKAGAGILFCTLSSHSTPSLVTFRPSKREGGGGSASRISFKATSSRSMNLDRKFPSSYESLREPMSLDEDKTKFRDKQKKEREAKSIREPSDIERKFQQSRFEKEKLSLDARPTHAGEHLQKRAIFHTSRLPSKIGSYREFSQPSNPHISCPSSQKDEKGGKVRYEMREKETRTTKGKKKRSLVMLSTEPIKGMAEKQPRKDECKKNRHDDEIYSPAKLRQNEKLHQGFYRLVPRGLDKEQRHEQGHRHAEGQGKGKTRREEDSERGPRAKRHKDRSEMKSDEDHHHPKVFLFSSPPI